MSVLSPAHALKFALDLDCAEASAIAAISLARIRVNMAGKSVEAVDFAKYYSKLCNFESHLDPENRPPFPGFHPPLEAARRGANASEKDLEGNPFKIATLSKSRQLELLSDVSLHSRARELMAAAGYTQSMISSMIAHYEPTATTPL